MTHEQNPIQYGYLFDKHTEAILIINLQLQISYANPAAAELFHYPGEELLQMDIKQVMVTDDGSTLDYYLQKALEGESPEFELTLTSSIRQEKIEIKVKTVPHVLIGQIHTVSFYIRDITEDRKQDLMNSKAAKELCESFIENNRDPILLLDREATIVLANRAFSRLLGWKKENLEGFHILQCPSIPPHLVKQMKDYFQKVVSVYRTDSVGDQNLDLLETIRITDKGKEYQMVLSITPVYMRGEICNWAVHLSDITGLKMMENKVERLEIEQAISTELNKIEHLNTVSQLAASISHEVRNPLTVTRGFIQLLRTPALPEDKKRDYINISLAELDRAESIIRDYLTFAKPTQEEVLLLDINKEMEYVANVMVPFATIKNVVYHTTKHAPHLYFYGDVKKFQQAFINLIKNGIEAMPNGGEIHIETFKEESNTAIIQITDTGMGMDAESIKRLGSPFYTTKDKGTGLGTMVAFRIINSMHGEIEIDSKVGVGTCFKIRFPIIDSSNGTD